MIDSASNSSQPKLTISAMKIGVETGTSVEANFKGLPYMDMVRLFAACHVQWKHALEELCLHNGLAPAKVCSDVRTVVDRFDGGDKTIVSLHQLKGGESHG